MKKLVVAILLFCITIYYFLADRSTPPPAPRPSVTRQNPRPTAAPPEVEAPVVASTAAVQVPPRAEPEIVTERSPKNKKPVLHFKLQNGLMIVQGDQVAGAPTRPDVPETGLVQMPPVTLWPRGNVPYHIQPSVPNPERVMDAIAMFEGTAIHLTPYKNEDDVLVFEPGDKDCLSYVGKMGGKQPLWISPGCRAEDIAHEILHALGFVHEQNRSDRDGFVIVHFENIDERYTDNFEKLPQEFMKVSGLGEFDYHSLMMYPAWMFAKNGQSTMDPLVKDQLIEPSSRLSPGDIERLNRAYGH